ncbi:hypothetical protein C5748_27275 [Phyllobacterium phragmitis]|uniref:Uncharacterized protein n=1 Tax=Phyllobacterium phragmitis TaxID=2670329 RepID=A0A2S9IIS1_9HYPH|nr:hypothetical protein [Phyllobacterium phragmitis]PRD40392.1 hypothetical protein C5748_27275 [Phyllobacterium phragmitis]
MTCGFIYRDMIEEIRAVCFQHVQGLVSANDVQRVVQRGELTIVAIEEKDIRNFLTNVEGLLEEIKFTVDDELQLAESQKVAQQVLLWLSERENKGSRYSSSD